MKTARGRRRAPAFPPPRCGDRLKRRLSVAPDREASAFFAALIGRILLQNTEGSVAVDSLYFYAKAPSDGPLAWIMRGDARIWFCFVCKEVIALFLVPFSISHLLARSSSASSSFLLGRLRRVVAG
ncbi:hypothetical protein M441DRAFT_385815 [Trichoderma asperellum CBS 433.97]|uniref:Uncharacterized protein n=1 Tax=Trichoderma asperellum (strain ATCC 204424 / CBS 433.97 / NBRC 101777) TaxID=1042311 RepID=A0A2T3ZBL2_TRIA4|nr:hypothetical protein M441DRAFT_385815 [Trichoderma asperellum CBS 433.97]PTB42198.1 hypothetical protein M441DRAFT_385815 [Trichoderma asperellum CBS 433.97]